VTIALLGLPPHSSRVRALGARFGKLALGGAVFVVIALLWLTGTLLFPASQRPYAIGSTNGSAWNAAFVFNGTDRLGGKAVEGVQPGFEASRRYPQATQAQRDQIPITPPSPTRLLTRIGPLPGQRLGILVLAALLLGAPAVLLGLRGPPVRVAFGAGLLVWLLTGVALFSEMVRLHPRYVEGFTPAVAALLGVGVAWATRDGAWRTRVLAIALATIAVRICSTGRSRSGGSRPSRPWSRSPYPRSRAP
jgi:hypothetical protein